METSCEWSTAAVKAVRWAFYCSVERRRGNESGGWRRANGRNRLYPAEFICASSYSEVPFLKGCSEAEGIIYRGNRDSPKLRYRRPLRLRFATT